MTGASGFIAAHIVRDLLARGYRVRGTVRDPGRKADLAFLTNLPGAAERLELVGADLAGGGYPGIFALTWGFVDVRDVARAHVLAMEVAGASGRYLCAGERLSMRELLIILREAGVRGKLPTFGLDNAVGTALVKLLSYAQPRGVGAYLRCHLGRVPTYDNGKIRRELGVEFRPARESVLDTLQDLRQRGLLQMA